MPQLQPGDRFAGYVIEGVLGRGGMGVVYQARSETALADRVVALKLVRPELADDERFVARFRDEARRAASIEHPAIVPVYDADEWGGTPYIAMRLIAGRNLAALVRARGPLDPSPVASIARDVAGALDAAHAAGVVHRDVKPQNILLDAGGRAYLTDFGLVHAASTSDRWTGTGAFVGTLAYVAPEQTEPGARIDGRADQYALACSLFEALANRPPFVEETDLQLVVAHRSSPPPRVSSFAADAAALDEPLLRALAKAPPDRFESCAQLAEAIDAAVAGRQPRHAGPAAAEPAGALIGRDDDLARVAQLLDERHVVTLTGAGGMGKTTLARAVLRRGAPAYPDGAYEVPLAPLRHDEMIVPAIGQALEVSDAGELTAEQLAEQLGDRRLLLLLDNAEHLAGVADVVRQLTAGAPGVHLLVTSRAPLRLGAEQEYAVGPLASPRDDRDLQAASVALFAERARRVDAGFEVKADNAAAVVSICRHTDGIPLALELAAAQMKVLSPSAVVGLLERRMPLPMPGMSDSDARHATMSSAIGWSYELLEPAERDLLDRLSVFVGGFGFEDAAAIAGRELSVTLEWLAHLLDHSLVDRSADERYRLLEPVRQFAAAQLAADLPREHDARRRHAQHFAVVADDIAQHLFGSGWLSGHDRVALDRDNFLAATEFALADDRLKTAVRIGAGVAPALVTIGYPPPLRTLLESGATRAAELPAALRGRLLAGVGDGRYELGERAGAEEAYREALELLEATGQLDVAAHTAHALAFSSWMYDDHAAAGAYIERAIELARRSAKEECAAPVLLVAYLIWSRSDDERAAAAMEEGLAITRRTGNDWVLTLAFHYQGVVLLEAGDDAGACEAFAESSARCPEFARVTIIANDLNLAQAHALGGRWDEATRSLASALEGRMRIFHPAVKVESLAVAASIAAARGTATRAARLAAAARRAADAAELPLPPPIVMLLDRVVGPAVEGLGDEEVERAHAPGAWSTAEALREADRLVSEQ